MSSYVNVVWAIGWYSTDSWVFSTQYLAMIIAIFWCNPYPLGGHAEEGYGSFVSVYLCNVIYFKAQIKVIFYLACGF